MPLSHPIALHTLRQGCVLFAVFILLGAFGAHALKSHVHTTQLELWHTAVFYGMIHSFGVMVVGFCVLLGCCSVARARWVRGLFTLGILLFCGSLVYLSLTVWLGKLPNALHYTMIAATPIGGVNFVLGWLVLAFGLKVQQKAP